MTDHQPRKTIHLDMDAMNAMRPRDLMEFKVHTGVDFMALADKDMKSLTTEELYGLAFLIERRHNPDVTWEEVGDMDITLQPPAADSPLVEPEPASANSGSAGPG